MSATSGEEKAAADKAAADKAAAEKTAAEKTAAEKTAAEKAVAEKAVAEKAAAEKAAAEKTAAEKTAAEKTAAEKTAQKKAAAEKAAEEEAAEVLEKQLRITALIRVFMPVIIIGVGILALAGIIIALAVDARIFQRLNEPGYARGVITFLISVATISIAFVLVFQAFILQKKDDADDTFRRSREIFAGLMGVLGTIVGFYFGSAEKAITPLEILDVRATQQQVLARVLGGTPPYGYVITLPELKPIKGVSKDGWIVEDLKPPTKAETKITVDVTDNKQQTISKFGVVPKGEGAQEVQKRDGGVEEKKPGGELSPPKPAK
jgi:hypothetical protein